MPKQFPFEFESKKKLEFYPQEISQLTADVLEIGPGRGDLILNLAEKNPSKKFIAVELGRKRYEKLKIRIQKRNLTNINLIFGDARIVLPKLGKPNTFEKIFVLFNDPWPKDKHAFHRLLTLEMLWFLAFLLKKDGELILATDHLEYAVQIESDLKIVHWLKNNIDDKKNFVSKLEDLPETYFQQMWTQMGKEIRFFKYKKMVE